jgi:serine O-acetyltransferase
MLPATMPADDPVPPVPDGPTGWACPCRRAGTLRAAIRADVDRYRYLVEHDWPGGSAGRNRLLVLLLYPGLYGVIGYRLAHAVESAPPPVRPVLEMLALVLQRVLILLTGVELAAHAHIGPGLMVNHARGVVVGAIDAGSNLTLSHSVTLGSGSPGSIGWPLPSFGDRVWIGPGAVVVGGIRVGHDAQIGANAVVLQDVPDRALAVGAPARVAHRRGSFADVRYRGMQDDAARAASAALADS